MSMEKAAVHVADDAVEVSKNIGTGMVEVSKQVIEALKPLAAKLGQTAEALFRMAVKDAFITGIESAIYMGIGLALLFSLFFVVPVFVREFRKQSSEMSEGVVAISIIYSLLALSAGFGLFLANLSSALHNLINPEYMALVNILHTVAGH